MDLPVRMRISYSVKPRYAICLKFGDKFLIFLTKSIVEVKASICSTIKENLLFHCRKFSAFFVVFIVLIFIVQGCSLKELL